MFIYVHNVSQHWFLSIRVQSHPPNLALLRETSGEPFMNVGGDRTNDTFLYLHKGVCGEVWWFPWRFCIVLWRLFARRITCSIFCTNVWLMVKVGALGFYADQWWTLFQRGFRIVKPLTREDSQTSKLPTLITNSNYLLSVFDPRFLLLVVRFGSRIWFDQIVVGVFCWPTEIQEKGGRSLAVERLSLRHSCGNDLEPLGWNTHVQHWCLHARPWRLKTLRTSWVSHHMSFDCSCIGWKWTCRGVCHNNKDLQEIHSLVKMCRYVIIQSYAYIMCITYCIYIYVNIHIYIYDRLVATHINHFKHILVGSPNYVETHPMPKNPRGSWLAQGDPQNLCWVPFQLP